MRQMFPLMGLIASNPGMHGDAFYWSLIVVLADGTEITLRMSSSDYNRLCQSIDPTAPFQLLDAIAKKIRN